MRISSVWTLVAVAIAGLAGCSSSGSDGPDAAPVVHHLPPDPGPSNPGDGTGATTFVISHLYLGATDPDGTADLADGWKHYGYDLDGKISTGTSTDLCHPAGAGDATHVDPDGDDGTDNNFGKDVLPAMLALVPALEDDINANLATGGGPLMISLQALGTGTDYNPIVTSGYLGGDLGATPRYDGTDAWPVRSDSLTAPTDLTMPRLAFPSAYLAGNTWVSGPRTTLADFTLRLDGHDLSFDLADAVITVELDATHHHGVHGVIAGVVSANQLATSVADLLTNYDSASCEGNPTREQLIETIVQAADILSDGSQDPAQTCDAVSIGLGFDAEEAQLGAITAPPIDPTPCKP